MTGYDMTRRDTVRRGQHFGISKQTPVCVAAHVRDCWPLKSSCSTTRNTFAMLIRDLIGHKRLHAVLASLTLQSGPSTVCAQP